MKKVLISLMVLVLSLVLISCGATASNKPGKDYFEKIGDNYYLQFDSMDTVITLRINKSDKKIKDRNKVAIEIKAIFDSLHQLTDNFRGYDGVNNINYINKNPNTKIEIDESLYNLLKTSEELKSETYGYFDISIGSIIDLWKDLMDKDTITMEDYNKTLAAAEAIEVIEDGITLESNKKKFYVTIKQGVKIDLGAIAKGYAVDLAKDIMNKAGFTYFEIRGSESSVYYGENTNPSRSYFTVGLTGPIGYENDAYWDPSLQNYYEIVKAQNTAVTTSGDQIQFREVGDIIIHHIVSPKSKKPENLRRMMSLVYSDATKSDALSTALFSMPENILQQWVNEEKNKEVALIFLNGDLTIERIHAKDVIYPVM